MRGVAQRKCNVCKALGLLVVALSLLQPNAQAAGQAAADVAAKPQVRHKYRHFSIDDQVKQLAKNLDLSETQQSEMKRILQQRQEQVRRLRSNPSFSGAERVDKFRSLQEGTATQIRAVLNEEQKKKYDPPRQRETSGTSPKASLEDWLKATKQK
jgi:hypothetical protein